MTDLPRELFEAVYDRLHVHDRMRLNAALPRGLRRKKSRNDDALALACLATKRRRRSASLSAFLLDNLAEPTVRSMLEEDAALGEELRGIARERDLRSARVDSAVFRDATMDELKVVVSDVIRAGTPERLEELAPIARRVFETRTGAFRCDALFSALNYRNEAMAAHLVSRGRELYGIDVDEMTRFVTEGFGKNLMTSPRTRQLILRVVPLTPEQRQTVIHSMLDDLDVEAYAYAHAQGAQQQLDVPPPEPLEEGGE